MARLAAWALLMQAACYGQPADEHRLRAILAEKQATKGYFTDTAYINTLNELAHSYYNSSADSLLMYANDALVCAKKAGYGKGEADGLRQLGNGYRLLGDYTHSLSYYFQSLAAAERFKLPVLMGQASINIALEYVDMHKNDEAIAMVMRARRYFDAAGDSTFLNLCLVTIGEVWTNRGQHDSAMHYFRQAYQVAEKQKDPYLLVATKDEIASALIMKRRYKEALAIYLHTFDYYIRTNNQTRVGMAAADLSWAYLKLKQYHKALKYADICLRMATAMKALPRMQQACELLADIYKGLGDYHKALSFQSRFIQISDTLSNEKIQTSAARSEARYDYEKKEALLREEQAKKDIRQEAIVKEKELEIWLSATAIMLLSVLAFLLFRSRAARQKINRELAAMNSEIMRQKEEIEHQSYQLLLNNQQKDKLFNIISHDLKTPLQSLNTVLDLLKTQPQSQTRLNRMIEELRHEVDHSSELVSNLLFWSNSQLNGIVAKPLPLNIGQLACEVLELFKKQASKKGIVLRHRFGAALQVHADIDMIHVVIRNLVSNAIKFCRAGDTITIEGKAAGAFVDICVSDTGVGMKEDVLEKIRGQKLVTTYGTAGEKGTGLGILLCQEFIDMNQGGFRVESKWGEGSRFCISLPAVDNNEQA